MENVTEDVVETVDVVAFVGVGNDVVEHQPPVPVVDTADKVDRRQGKRRVENADGTVSYGLKADGTPRGKPGRRKTAPVVQNEVESVGPGEV